MTSDIFLSPSFVSAFSNERTNEGPKMASNNSMISFFQLRNSSSEFLPLDIFGGYSNELCSHLH